MDKKLEIFQKNVEALEEPLIARLRKDLAELLAEQPELNTAFHLRRFLHARENDYKKAHAMLQNCLLFRKSKGMARIASMDMNSERMRKFRDYYAAGHYGCDKEGRLVIIERVGQYDYKGMTKDFAIDEIEDYIMQLQERILFIELPILSELFNRRIDRVLVILDLKNLSLSKLLKPTFRHFISTAMRVTSDCYPEMMGKSIFINAPLGTQSMWSMIKLGLDQKTAAKFEISSGNGRKELSKYLDFDMLPLEIGGKNTVSLQHGFGPYMDEIRRSYAAKRLFLGDREIEYKWFWTQDERENLTKETKSTVAQTGTEHSDNQSPLFKSDIKRSKNANRQDMNKSAVAKTSTDKSGVNRTMQIADIRVNSYFTTRPLFR
jgi:hypothetical protein